MELIITIIITTTIIIMTIKNFSICKRSTQSYLKERKVQERISLRFLNLRKAEILILNNQPSLLIQFTLMNLLEKYLFISK